MRSTMVMLALGLAGCAASLGFVPTRQPPHMPQTRGAEGVEVYMTGAPSRPFVEVGLVEVQAAGFLGDNDAASLIAEMREYAGELGCDALVIFAGNDTVSGGADVPVSTQKGYRGSCLMYIDAPSATPNPVGSLASQRCIPNSTLSCHGPGGCRGGQRCNADGQSYTLCDCSGPRSPASAALR